MTCRPTLPVCTRRLAILCLLAVFLIGIPFNKAFARYASVLMDAESGRVLHEINGDVRRYPASLTKLMTLYLLFQAIDTGQVTLDSRMAVSAHAAGQPPSKLGLSTKERLRVAEAILALVTKSANDVAAVVAEHLGGTESQFAMLMTQEASRLGMDQTVFRNASGLPDSNQVTTAHDMARLGRALLRDFPHHYHYFGTRQFAHDGITYANHNRMLGTYDGLDGMKTGYINASGFNLVASARRGGDRLIGVVFGAQSPGERARIMADLLDEGFQALDTGGVVPVAAGRRMAGPVAVAEARVQPEPAPQAKAGRSKRSTAAAMGSRPTTAKPAKAAKPTTVWAIQLSSYADRNGASSAAKQAIQKTKGVLAKGTVHVVREQKARSKKPAYVARVVDLNKDQASRACTLLKAKKQACSVVRAS
jgi:D-alanyl-D-alanine carboxypeptidase